MVKDTSKISRVTNSSNSKEMTTISESSNKEGSIADKEATQGQIAVVQAVIIQAQIPALCTLKVSIEHTF